MAQARGGGYLRVEVLEAVELFLEALLELLGVLVLVQGTPVSVYRANDKDVGCDAERDEGQRAGQDQAAATDGADLHHDEEKRPNEQRLRYGQAAQQHLSPRCGQALDLLLFEQRLKQSSPHEDDGNKEEMDDGRLHQGSRLNGFQGVFVSAGHPQCAACHLAQKHEEHGHGGGDESPGKGDCAPVEQGRQNEHAGGGNDGMGNEGGRAASREPDQEGRAGKHRLQGHKKPTPPHGQKRCLDVDDRNLRDAWEKHRQKFAHE